MSGYKWPVARKGHATFLGLMIMASFAVSGCVTRDDIMQLDSSVDSLDSAVSELNGTLQTLRKPIVLTAVPACGTPGQEKKINLNIEFSNNGECLYPGEVKSLDNGCEDKTEVDIACVCRSKVPKTKITWQAVDSSGEPIAHEYRIFFGPLYLESDNQGRIRDKTIAADAPLGSHKYSIVSGSCERDPHVIIGN